MRPKRQKRATALGGEEEAATVFLRHNSLKEQDERGKDERGELARPWVASVCGTVSARGGEGGQPQEDQSRRQALRENVGPRLLVAIVRFAGFASVFSDSLFGEGREVTIFSHISKF